MKNILTALIIFTLAAGFFSCRKTSFITSRDALLSTSVDTLHFDTVFTTTGSVTHSFKIINLNDQKLKLSTVKLMGGSASFFKMNVDGTAGNSFSNIEVEAKDSIYVFVTVTINPNTANLAFIVRDSILISFNGNNNFVQLDAFGQNANFYRNRRITKDSAWNNNLPFVILGGITVDSNITLTINKGCKIYCHADAPFIVNGILKVLGQRFDSTKVIFRGDRLDPDYRDFPGSWPGIFFTKSSRDNVMNYAVIKNAYQGVIAQLPPSAGNAAKVTLNECIIDNIYDAGIITQYSSVSARNCLITNCGNNIGITAGGSYSFTHCTVASYSIFSPRKNPVLFISNDAGGGQTLPLSATFTNCIFYGEGGSVDDEIVVDTKVNPSALIFDHVLYKAVKTPAGTFSFPLRNVSPQFDSIDVSKRLFNFELKAGSPAIDKGNTSTTGSFDLNNKQRINTPDLGCYEKN